MSFAKLGKEQNLDKGFEEVGDTPTTQDLLGFKRFADPLAQVISMDFSHNLDGGTQITIGVYGEWGSGKTSFLKMVDDILRKESIDPIWFNAWKYDKEDNLWAALIQTILDQATVRKKWYRIAWVKFVIWKDSIRLRDGFWEVFKKLLPLLLRLLLILISLYIFLGLDKKVIEAFLSQWLPDNTVLPRFVQVDIVKAVGAFAAIVAATPFNLISLLEGKLNIDYSKFSHKPSYREHIAFLDEFGKEFEKIIRLLWRGKPLVVIIDDLDRCLPEKTIQILEAIKNFLDVRGCVFLLGLDKAIVEKAVAVKYKEMIVLDADSKNDSTPPKRTNFQGDYTDKIIQLSIFLPRLSRSQVKEFVTKVSADKDIRQSASIFGEGLPPNPRKIKRILRAFLFVRDMAIEDVRNGSIKPPLLAKLIVIQNQFPDIFEAVAERPVLLEELENYYRMQEKGVAEQHSVTNGGGSIQLEPVDKLFRDQAEKYASAHPELPRTLLSQVGDGATFAKADFGRYIALIGALAVVIPRTEAFKYGKVSLVELDELLQRVLPSLLSTREEDREPLVRRLLVDLLRLAARAFASDVHRAVILLPDAANEYLKIGASYQIPEVSRIRTKFYIGEDKSRIAARGVAGVAYLGQEMEIAHIGKEADGVWHFDTPSYIQFDEQRHYPPYRSFVNVPIIEVSTDASVSKCNGVVCFDSFNPTTFDAPAAQELLIQISKRISSVLSIYRQGLTPV
jgi:KAP family P-loop domain